MKRPGLTVPWNYAVSGISGWTRAHWEESAEILLSAIIDGASPGCARQVIPGPRSHHGRLADELEGFTRSFIMAAPYLMHRPDGVFECGGRRYDCAEFYRRGILSGTDPAHPEYWGDPVDFAQHLVECASLAWGLHQSRRLIWDSFSEPEKRRVAEYLYRCTQVKYHRNNWLLFNVVTNAALKRLGMPYTQSQIDENLGVCETMYLGSGWYRDGDVPRIDYYNAWAFHYYYLIWVILDGDSDPGRAALHRDRARAFAESFRYFFGADGAAPCFGRSEIYRFAYLAPLALGRFLGCLSLPDGELKTVTGLGVKYFLTKEILTDSGHLSLGYVKPCAEMLEHYSCGGSPYWASKAFNLLMLPPSDPFWSAAEEPLPVQTGSYAVAIREAGLVVTGDRRSGHVQLVNQNARHDKPEYNDKYTKFAYSSLFPYEARAIHGSFNCDTVLQFSDDGILFSQRWTMENLLTEPDCAVSRYPLYGADPEGSVTTVIFVKDDFYITFHEIRSRKELRLREGGYPLGFDSGAPVIERRADAEGAFLDRKASVIRSLSGWNTAGTRPFGEDIAGSNVRYHRSVVPALAARKPSGDEPLYLAAFVCARLGEDTMDQLTGIVSAEREGNRLSLAFADGERVLLCTGELGADTFRFEGREFSGPVRLVRRRTDGTFRTVTDTPAPENREPVRTPARGAERHG